MPSGRFNGPEKRRSTVRDDCAGCCASGTSRAWHLVDAGEWLIGWHCGRKPRWLIMTSVGRQGSDWRSVRWRFRSPRHYSRHAGYVDAVRPGRSQTAAEINANPGARLHTRFIAGDTGFHGESAAAKRQDGHDARFGSGESLVRGEVAAGWTCCSIEYVD
eukprot:6213432-Pleurochrysis_carterae.AAC.3